MQEVITLEGKSPGNTSIILGGVHGNEVCGVEALNQLLPNLQIESGKVFFAYANPPAIEKKVRYTEANLNRMFVDPEKLTEEEKSSYEFSRAEFLKEYLSQADALLDVHASSNPKSKPFMICEPNSYDIIKALPIETVVHGFDEVEPGGTDYFMNKIGKVGICVECGFLEDPQSTVRAVDSIMAFLKQRGHIPGVAVTTKKSYIHMYKLYKSQTEEFRLVKPFEDFEKMQAGDLIGQDDGEVVYCERNGIILFAKNSTYKGQEVFLLGADIDPE